jgi:hypothetical protein
MANHGSNDELTFKFSIPAMQDTKQLINCRVRFYLRSYGINLYLATNCS